MSALPTRDDIARQVLVMAEETLGFDPGEATERLVVTANPSSGIGSEFESIDIMDFAWKLEKAFNLKNLHDSFQATPGMTLADVIDSVVMYLHQVDPDDLVKPTAIIDETPDSPDKNDKPYVGFL